MAILIQAIRPATDPDLWWHLATGRYIVTQHRIPAADIFSFTAQGRHWVTHEWLTEVLLYGVYRLAGFPGLILLFALLITAAFALVYRRCHTRPLLAALCVLLAALASSLTWNVRPQMLTLLFASLYLYILDGYAAGGRRAWLWALPPLTLLWANLHSGFTAGLALIAAYAVGQELSWLGRRAGQGPWLAPQAVRLALTGALCALCALVTPNGLAGALFAFGTLSNGLIQANIQEWFSPNFHQPMAWPLLAFLLALLATLGLSRRRLSATEALLLAGTGAAALYSARHAPFLALAGAPLLARQAEDLFAGPARRRPLSPLMRRGLIVVLVGLVALLDVRLFRTVAGNTQAQEETYPVAAVAYLREHGLGERIFNTYQWGGYLIWQGFPVFVDGRAELYGDKILSEYLQTAHVQADWEAPLQRYHVDTVLIETGSPLAVVLAESGRWRAVYRDKLATVFVPVGAGPAA